MDFRAIIGEMQDVLNAGPDHETLRWIRSTLEDPVFLLGWKEYLEPRMTMRIVRNASRGWGEL